jgi:hypothetical protein
MQMQVPADSESESESESRRHLTVSHIYPQSTSPAYKHNTPNNTFSYLRFVMFYLYRMEICGEREVHETIDIMHERLILVSFVSVRPGLFRHAFFLHLRIRTLTFQVDVCSRCSGNWIWKLIPHSFVM